MVSLARMGLEATCTLRLDHEMFSGKAHLDSERLTFRGGAKFDLALKEIKSAEVAKGGELVLAHALGTAVLGLGDDRATAEKWALKIRSPRSLVDKLDLKPGARTVVLGVDDVKFLAQAAERLGASSPRALPAAAECTRFYFLRRR